MIEYMHGNLFDSPAEALVNTVNCVGVMGKGIAYQFRRAFPATYADYQQRCMRGEIRPGQVTSFREKNRLIVNFPTKRHWRSLSRLEDIEAGLQALRKLIETEGIRHIVLPPLGCGNGGLSWNDVRPAIERHLGDLADVRINVYEPHGAFSSRVATDPKLSLGHFVLAALRSHLVESKAIALQKAAYFFNVYSGEPYFRFIRHKYGPYCPALEPMFRQIKDYLDFHQMKVADMVRDGAERKLAGRDADRLRSWELAIQSASALCNRLRVDLEAAATVHAILAEQGDMVVDGIVRAFFDWSPEKIRFQPADVLRAVSVLENEGLIERTLLGYRAAPPRITTPRGPEASA
jgi:O-acetyl-ADP-ribose deacetylase (regulator of RNase III)